MNTKSICMKPGVRVTGWKANSGTTGIMFN